MATPCRSEASCPQTPHEPAPPLDHLEIPLDGDTKAPIPIAGELRLSENAVNLRMRRVFQPSIKTGEFRVAENIRKMYAEKRSRPKLLSIFQSCGFDPDRVGDQILCFISFNDTSSKVSISIVDYSGRSSAAPYASCRKASFKSVSFSQKSYYQTNL